MRLQKSWLAAFALVSSVNCVAGEAEVRAAILKLNPQAQIESIKVTPMAGVFEAVVAGTPMYLSADGNYLIQGQLMETKTRKNLSELGMAVRRVPDLKSVDLKQAIVFAPKYAPAKHRIKVFTDVDCGYCRKLHGEMDRYNALGIEVQYLFFPRAGTSSASADVAQSVYCAKDQHAAMTAAQSGQTVAPAHCPNPVQAHFDLGIKLGVGNVGTPSIFLENGELLPGYVPADQLLAILNDKVPQPVAKK